MVRHLVTHAARDGARLAVVNSKRLTTEDIKSRVTNSLAGQVRPTITVYEADGNGLSIGDWTKAEYGERIAVEVDAAYRPLFAGLGILSDTMRVRTKAIMRSEAY